MPALHFKDKGFTIQDMIDAGFPLDRPFVLQDPDTDWPMHPDFIVYDDCINIYSDYSKDRQKGL